MQFTYNCIYVITILGMLTSWLPIAESITDVKTAIACESHSQVLQIKCEKGEVIQILQANYGRTNAGVCPHPAVSNKNCYAASSLTKVANICNNKQSCSVSPSNNVFGDPCVGTYKYLNVQYQCKKAPPCKDTEFQCNDGSCIGESSVSDGFRDCRNGEDETGVDYESAYACEGHTININCRRGQVITVISANYGRRSRNICSRDMYNINCKSSKSLNILRERCNQKVSCSVPSTNHIFGDPCVGTYKYTEVHYQCAEIPPCLSNEFQCDTSHCLNISKKCDGNRDCQGGEDEHGCDYITDYSCENSVLEIECKKGDLIKIIGANYGRKLSYICVYQEYVNCESKTSKQKLQERCNGKRKCNIAATNVEFGDPCIGTLKYLAVNYQCIAEGNEISIFAPKAE